MRLRWAGTWGMIAGLVLGAYAVLSFVLDEFQLREQARRVVGSRTSATEKTSVLLDWVHAIPQTAENRRFFLLPGLRATPMQVLESGGDCADKSRLLSAMLHQVGVESTLVMLFDPRTGRSTHTVVCAFLENGSTMVVDPAYRLSFPDQDSGRFLGLLELRRDPSRLDDRLTELRQSRGRRDPVQVYDAAAAGYSLASSMNWNRNVLTRTLRALLHPSWGENLYAMARPRILEEPKLLIALMGVSMTAAIWIFGRAALGVREFVRSWSTPAKAQRQPKLSRWKAVGI